MDDKGEFVMPIGVSIQLYSSCVVILLNKPKDFIVTKVCQLIQVLLTN